ncbi:MAG: hypothetical protein ABI165_05165 [Bryobacteraceae bacterium]
MALAVTIALVGFLVALRLWLPPDPPVFSTYRWRGGVYDAECALGGFRWPAPIAIFAAMS